MAVKDSTATDVDLSWAGATVTPPDYAVWTTVDGGDPSGTVRCHLFAHAEVQAHVQKRVGLTGLDCVFLVHRLAERGVELGVFLYDPRDLGLEWGERLPVAVLCPGLHVHRAQFVTIAAENHPLSLFRNSHHPAMAHSPHNGLRALHT